MANRKTKQELEVEVEDHKFVEARMKSKVAHLEGEKLKLENEIDMKTADRIRAAKRANLMEARVQVMQLEVVAAEAKSEVLTEVLTDAISRLS